MKKIIFVYSLIISFIIGVAFCINNYFPKGGKSMKRIIILTLIFFFFSYPVLAARQDLDEALARKARYSTNTFYSGEAGSYYVWQPETFSYTDTNWGHEVWALAWMPYSEDLWGADHGQDAWSTDGKRMIFSDAANLRISGDPSLSPVVRKWVVNTDGTVLRGLQGPKYSLPIWAQTDPATYYTEGGINGGTVTQIWKCILDSNNTPITTSLVKDLSSISGGTFNFFRNGLGGSDKWLVMQDTDLQERPDPNPDVTLSQGVIFLDLTTTPATIANYWGFARGIGNYHSHTNLMEGDPQLKDPPYYTTLKDSWTIGGATSPWIMQFFSADSTWFLFKKSGSDTDGGPQFHAWNGSSWGSPEEIKVISDPPPVVNPYSNFYFGHPVVDRWGRYILAGQYSGTMGTKVFDSKAIIDSNLSGEQATVPLNAGLSDGYHHSWYGYTDYVVGENVDDDSDIKINKWNSSSTNQITIASTEYCGYHSDYGSYPRVSQSPDGTKVAFSSVLMQSPYDNSSTEDNRYGIFYAVAMYPYPPEIYSISATGGTVTATFDWGTHSGKWRGYTQRKWPDESTGAYLPPRETSKFRLWRSTDKSTWTPVGTVDADIFTKYDFANGGYKKGQNAYWTIADSPGNGTFYYAVTAIENSGLESRTLGNIFSITVSGGSDTGSQDIAYPANPGKGSLGLGKGSSNFYTSYLGTNTSLIKHYNIYACEAGSGTCTGGVPAIAQQRRIASISRNACVSGNCSWVDWLGKTDGTTQYKVTPVDTQGNEGSALSLTRTVLATAGQYRLDWREVQTPGTDTTPPAAPTGVTVS